MCHGGPVDKLWMGYASYFHLELLFTGFLDRHIWDQKPQWFQASEAVRECKWLSMRRYANIKQFDYACQIQYITLITCTKLSALCTYLRISKNTKYRKFIWVTVIVVALWGICESLL
jgi:hypothetical protein